MFTLNSVDEKKLQSPPVANCGCTYCTGMRLYGRAVNGHGAPSSHRLRGGDEHHNPENIARLALQKIVSPEQFAEYTRTPGGATLTFQSKLTQLWYKAGRVNGTPGHYVMAYDPSGKEIIAVLCIPPRIENAPLASIVLGHYLALMYDEANAWATSAAEFYSAASIVDTGVWDKINVAPNIDDNTYNYEGDPEDGD